MPRERARRRTRFKTTEHQPSGEALESPNRASASGDARAISLNENHARAISTTLSKIEKDINEIERYISSPPRGRMYEMVDDLTGAQKEALLATISLLRECVREFANQFDLRPDRVNLSGVVQGKLAVDWANACDIQAAKLRAYGVVDPTVGRAVDAHAEKLIEVLSSGR